MCEDASEDQNEIKQITSKLKKKIITLEVLPKPVNVLYLYFIVCSVI